MAYIFESFEEFLNEKMTPAEKKERRKQRRQAKKSGEKLPRVSKGNKAGAMTPEDLLQAVKDVSPSYRLEWTTWGDKSFEAETGDRGPRTDHGGGEDGDDWMDEYQQEDAARPYKKKWQPKLDQMVKDLAKKGIKAQGYVDYGEKGHISLEISIIS